MNRSGCTPTKPSAKSSAWYAALVRGLGRGGLSTPPNACELTINCLMVKWNERGPKA